MVSVVILYGRVVNVVVVSVVVLCVSDVISWGRKNCNVYSVKYRFL